MESLHRKNFNPKGQFMVCLEHFNKDCFKRLFHMEGNAKRLEPGSIPTVCRKTELSADQLRAPRIDAVVNYTESAAVISFLNCVRVIFPVH